MGRRQKKPAEGANAARKPLSANPAPAASESEDDSKISSNLPARTVAQLEQAWIQLRGKWSWLAVVPGDRSLSVARVGRALCSVASRLSVNPIRFLEARDVDLDVASRLINQLGIANHPGRPWSSSGRPLLPGDHPDAPIPRTIVATENPLANPLVLPVVFAADGVVLCVRRGKSRIAEVRQTIEAVGPDHILCCLLID